MDKRMSFLEKAYTVPENKNYNKLLNLIKSNKPLKILDVGCGNCKNTIKIKRVCPNSKISGLDSFECSLKIGYEDINLKKVNLEIDRFPFNKEYFDIVLSNMVIEHVDDINNFISEQKRVLKVGGKLIISTNNASSWHNIIALVFGWQPFDLTNITLDVGLGNPFAVHKGVHKEKKAIGLGHKRIYTIRYLNDYLRLKGFYNIRAYGEGYFPLPSIFGKLDKIHSQFFIIEGIKNE